MKKLIVLFIVTLLQGCAFTDVTLDITEDNAAAFKGPLSSIEPTVFRLEELGDNRSDKERIGWVKNGYGANTADIFSSKPVNEVVLNAVQTALTKNGHSVGEQGRITVSGDVNQFWFESDVNFWTIEFIGAIEFSAVFKDKLSDEVIYESVYNGSYSEKVGAGYKKTWEKVMSNALNNLIEEIIFDEELARSIEEISNVNSSKTSGQATNLSFFNVAPK